MHPENDGNNLSFWDHLEALRGVLLRIFAVVVALMTGFFFAMPWIFEHIILWPCDSSVPLYSMMDWLHGDGEILPDMSGRDFHINLINIKLGTQLMTHLSTSMWLGIAVAFPVIIYLLWTFVSPGLYEKERRGARKAFALGNVMFYSGVMLGYFVVFPLALRFLSEYSLSDSIDNQLTLDSYMDTFYTVIVSMGLVFELPLLGWMLGRMGLIDRAFFRRNRKYAVFAMALIAGMITPTSDIFTMLVVFIPLYSLWEFSAFLVPASES